MTQATETLEERTTTTTEARVEEVEVQEVRCPHCEQWYETDHIVPVRIGPEDDPAHSEAAGICEHCAGSIYGYEPEHDLTDLVLPETDHWTWREYLSAVAAPSILLGSLGFALTSFASVLGSISAASTEIAASTEFSNAVSAMVFELVPLITVLLITMSVASTILRGGI
jgi:hypothetical protein